MQITTFSILGIMISCLLPYFWTGFAKITSKTYNNSTTRDSAEKFSGKSRRAHFAHLNSFEAIPFFAVSVLIAHINNVTESTIHTLIAVYLFFRILYGCFYIFDFPNLRSIVWFFALICNVALIALAIP